MDLTKTEEENLTALEDAVARLNRVMGETRVGGTLSGVKSIDIPTVVWMNKVDLLHPAPNDYPNIRESIPEYNEILEPFAEQLHSIHTFLVGAVQLHQLHGSALVSAKREPENELSLHRREERPQVQVIVGQPLWDGIKDAIDKLLSDIYPAPPQPVPAKTSLPSSSSSQTVGSDEPSRRYGYSNKASDVDR